MVSRLIILTLLAGVGVSLGAPSLSFASSAKKLPRQSIPITVPGYEPGSFTSPGYPSSYENNLSVEYVITAPEGHRIHFYAESFDLEESFDTLSLVEIDPVYGKVRLGSFYPAHGITTLQSNTNVVRASFQTDGTVVRGGFHITAWSFPTHTDPTVPEPEPTSPYDQVVQVFANSQGVIFTSPGYPNAYDNNLQIQYHIHAAAGHQIRFDAQAYDLESGYDTLTFFERRPWSDTIDLIGSFDNATQLWSRTEHVIAVFSTDGSETRTGFAVRAVSFLRGSVTHPPIMPPSRPPATTYRPEPTTATDRPEPTTAPNRPPTTTNRPEPTTAPNRPPTTTNRPEPTTAPNRPPTTTYRPEPTTAPDRPPTTREYLGTATEAEFTTEGYTDGYDGYTTDPPYGTAEPADIDIFVNKPVVLRSPGYPDMYPNNFRVVYSIRAPKGYYLQFDVEFASLEMCCDSVRFLEYPSNMHEVTIKTLGPAGSVGRFRSTMSSVSAVFRSDHSVGGGFVIGIRSVRMGTK